MSDESIRLRKLAQGVDDEVTIAEQLEFAERNEGTPEEKTILCFIRIRLILDGVSLK